jgi:hypothetical protein
MTPHGGGDSYRSPKSRFPRGPGCPPFGLPGWVTGRGDEKPCSRSASTGRGPGASAPDMRCFRPASGTPMWSGPRHWPVPVIAPGQRQPRPSASYRRRRRHDDARCPPRSHRAQPGWHPVPPGALAGMTGRLATASTRRPRRVLAAWGLLVLASLALAATSLHGLILAVVPAALHERKALASAARQCDHALSPRHHQCAAHHRHLGNPRLKEDCQSCARPPVATPTPLP